MQKIKERVKIKELKNIKKKSYKMKKDEYLDKIIKKIESLIILKYFIKKEIRQKLFYREQKRDKQFGYRRDRY